MRYNLKKYLSVGFVTIWVLFVITNCQKEELKIDQSHDSISLSYRITSLNNIKKLKPVIDNVKRIQARISGANRELSDFLPLENIDTSKVIQYTDSTGYSTYAFQIANENINSINFENLYLLESEDGYIGYILSYEPEQNWYNSHLIYQHDEYVLDMTDYVGDITKFSFDREVIWSTKQENANSTSTSRSEFIIECTVSVQMICTCNVHSEGNWYGCICLDMAKVENCETVWTGGSSSDGGESEGNSDSSTSGGGDTGDDCNTKGTKIINDQPLSGVNEDCTPNEGTGVLPPDQRHVDEINCEELNKLTSNPAYNSPNPYTQDGHIDNPNGLNTNIRTAITNIDDNLDSNYEHGFGFYNRGNFPEYGPYAHHIPAGAERQVLFPGHPYQYGTLHTHPDDGDTIPMFSHDDIYSLLDLKNKYTIPLLNANNPNGVNLFVCVLVVKQGLQTKTYALKIDDVTKLQGLQTHKQTETKWEEFGEILQNKYEKDANGVNGSITQYQKAFLEFLQDNDLGVSLYEMEQENVGTPFVSENWSKLTLNATSPNGIKKEPCND